MSSQQKRNYLKSSHVLYALLVIVSIVLGLSSAYLPQKILLALIAAIPAVVVVVYIFRKPYRGVFSYYIYEYLRPYDFIPGLQSLRLAMVIEIVTLISWGFWIMVTKEKVKWFNINYYYIFFIAVIAVGVFFAANNKYAFDVFQIMLIYFIIYFIAIQSVDSYEKISKLIWILLIIHFYLAIKGIMNFVIGNPMGTSGNVISGYLSDENDFAMGINVMIPFAYFFIFRIQSRFKKIVAIIFFVSFVLAVVSSFSRGGWVGLMVILFMCIMFSKKRMAAFSILLFLAIPVALFAPSKYWTEMQSISDTSESTADARIKYWKSAVSMYSDFPIIGVGAGNGGVWLPNYYVGSRDSATQWGRAFHGTLPQVLAELGTFGIAFYFLIMLTVIRYMFKVRRESDDEDDSQANVLLANGVIVSIIGYQATAVFISTAYYPQFWTLCSIGMCIYSCHYYKMKNIDLTDEEKL